MNKTSFMNQTVEVNETFTFEDMIGFERLLKDAYLDAATGGEVNRAKEIKRLGEKLGIDAETLCDDTAPSESGALDDDDKPF